MGMTRVRKLKPRAALLVVGLQLATLLVLALSACSGAGGQEEAKARPLPLYPTGPKALRPGEYHSVKFKPPLSFKVGKGWINSGPEGGGQREVERLVGVFGAYSPECVEGKFCEVRARVFSEVRPLVYRWARKSQRLR